MLFLFSDLFPEAIAHLINQPQPRRQHVLIEYFHGSLHKGLKTQIAFIADILQLLTKTHEIEVAGKGRLMLIGHPVVIMNVKRFDPVAQNRDIGSAVDTQKIQMPRIQA